MKTKLQGLVSRITAKLLAAAAIALSTATAWVLYELLVRGGVDNAADSWVRGAGRLLGEALSLDPIVAAFAGLLVVFTVISLVAFTIIRASS